MPPFTRIPARRAMSTIACARRRIQQLGPYQSLFLLMVPVGLVEPLKIIALFVAGTGHWFSGMTMIVGAYAGSIFLVERLFKVVKPKLMMLGWFAYSWTYITSFAAKAFASLRGKLTRISAEVSSTRKSG